MGTHVSRRTPRENRVCGIFLFGRDSIDSRGFGGFVCTYVGGMCVVWAETEEILCKNYGIGSQQSIDGRRGRRGRGG